MSAAWLSGCAGRPAGTTPTREPTTSPPVAETHEAAESPGMETATPVGEKETISPTRTPLTEEEIMTPDDTVPPSAQQVVQLAKEDLARRLDLPPEAIEVVSVEEVDWPDTSLGCPEPGMMYAQVITPGFQVVLEAEGQMYEYHTGGRQLVLCGDDGQPHIRLWPTVLPDEQDAEFDQEKLMEVESLIREKESLGYDVRTARVYLATAQWMNLQERPAQANAYLDLALEALEEAQEAGKIPSEQLRGTVVPLPTFVPEPESTKGD
jgi:hypothetical protein